MGIFSAAHMKHQHILCAANCIYDVLTHRHSVYLNIVLDTQLNWMTKSESGESSVALHSFIRRISNTNNTKTKTHWTQTNGVIRCLEMLLLCINTERYLRNNFFFAQKHFWMKWREIETEDGGESCIWHIDIHKTTNERHVKSSQKRWRFDMQEQEHF